MMDDMQTIYRKIGQGQVEIAVRDRSQRWLGVRYEHEASLLPPDHPFAPLPPLSWFERLASRIRVWWWNHVRRPF